MSYRNVNPSRKNFNALPKNVNHSSKMGESVNFLPFPLPFFSPFLSSSFPSLIKENLKISAKYPEPSPLNIALPSWSMTSSLLHLAGL